MGVMACVDGKLKENEGQTVESIGKSYVAESDESDVDEEVTEVENMPTRRVFPKDIGKKMFEDDELKKYLDERKIPPMAAIKRFLRTHPLPSGWDWTDVKGKFHTKIQNLNKKDAHDKENPTKKNAEKKDDSKKRKLPQDNYN